jgi:hypothetical protein
MADQPQVSVFTPPRPTANPAPAAPVFRSSPVLDGRQVDGTQSSPLQSEPQRRWAEMQAEIVAADPWKNPDVLITKDKDGTIRTQPRTDRAVSTARADAGTQPGAQPPQPTPTGPASVADGKLVVGDLTLDADSIKGLMERHALEQSRRANTPADAASYNLDLPSDFVLPAGVGEFKFDLENPVSAASIGMLKEYSKSIGLSQPEFSRILGIYAGHHVSEQQKFAEAQRAEIAKLGVNAPTRVDAVTTWLEAQVGSDLAGALRKTMFTAKSVEAYERLLRNFTSQGVSGNPAVGRDGAPREPARLSDDEYAKLSFAEKTAYARQFDQSQFR